MADELIERLHLRGRNLNVANGNHIDREDMCFEAQLCFDAKDDIQAKVQAIATLTAENERLREALGKMLGEASRRYETTPSGRAHYTKAYAAEIAALLEKQ